MLEIFEWKGGRQRTTTVTPLGPPIRAPPRSKQKGPERRPIFFYITHIDLRQVEQDVLIWGPEPRLGI